jgi:MFS family permease
LGVPNDELMALFGVRIEMCVRRDLLLWFVLLYGILYCSFGLSSPFLPEFLTTRGIGAEWLGFLLGAGTAVRLLSAPFAGRLADVFGIFRLELALFALAAAAASLLYLPMHNFWLLAFVNLTQAAMLAPLLSWSRSTTRGRPMRARYFGKQSRRPTIPPRSRRRASESQSVWKIYAGGDQVGVLPH